jgi:hypothetical protein
VTLSIFTDTQYSLYVFSPVGVQLGHYESDSDTLGGIERVTWSQDGLLAIGDSEGCVRLLESESWSPIATLRVRDSTAWRESTTATTRSGPRFTHCMLVLLT